MKKLLFFLFLIILSSGVHAKTFDCFESEYNQFHLAFGPDHIADFSFTSARIARKLAIELGGSTFTTYKSGHININTDSCTEDDLVILCNIESDNQVTIYNSFNRFVVRSSGHAGVIRFNRLKNVLEIDYGREKAEMSFGPNSCRK